MPLYSPHQGLEQAFWTQNRKRTQHHKVHSCFIRKIKSLSHIGNQSLCVGGWRDSWEHRDGSREENTVASEEGEGKWVGEQPLYPSALKPQWRRTLVDWQLGYPENNGALHVRQGTEKTAFPSLPGFICSKAEQYISMKFHRFPCHLSLFLSLPTYCPLSFPLTKITLGELREWSRVQHSTIWKREGRRKFKRVCILELPW